MSLEIVEALNYTSVKQCCDSREYMSNICLIQHGLQAFVTIWMRLTELVDSQHSCIMYLLHNWCFLYSSHDALCDCCDSWGEKESISGLSLFIIAEVGSIAIAETLTTSREALLLVLWKCLGITSWCVSLPIVQSESWCREKVAETLQVVLYEVTFDFHKALLQ